jgi:hypothetical protein
MWVDLFPVERTAVEKQITVSATAGRNGGFPKLLISIRPKLIEDCPAWLVAGANIGAAIGRDAHAGQLRLTPKGKHPLTLCKVGIKVSSETLHLKLRGVPGIVKMKPRIVEFDFSVEWLEITLPESSGVVPPKASMVAANAAPPLAGKSSGLGKPDETRAFSTLGGSIR